MSLVLVDTSAWIDFFQDESSPYGAVVDALLKEDLACTTGLVKAEIIPVAKNRKEFNELKDCFDALPLLADPPEMWDEIINAQCKLKKNGVNGVGIPDLIIAVTAIANDVVIFSKDHHFDLMEKILGLEVFRP